ncbi:NAD(+)/NADH kinase [Chlamydiota bacterium]
MKRVAIVANVNKTSVIDEVKKIIQKLLQKNMTIFLDSALSKKVSFPQYTASNEELYSQADLLIAVGGDGTFLKYSKKIKREGLPILGINLGRLGFLTEFFLEDFYQQFDAIISGEFSTKKRALLETVQLRDGKVLDSFLSLNDTVLAKENIARMLHVSVKVDDIFLTTYSCDGLIISTPTGSTAYSFSAGGPIVIPSSEVNLITPICPYTLSNRPIVLSAQSHISLKLEQDVSLAKLTLDGQQVVDVEKGDIITVKRADTVVSQVVSPYVFFEIVRNKLGWKGSHLL